MGYNLVFDHYHQEHGRTIHEHGDGIYWHYHQPAPSGIGNEWCSDWTHTQEYERVLAHMVLDRGFYPSAFRAGGRIENNDLSHWIEERVIFDYSCCSGNVNWEKIESDGKKLREVCDWSKAPLSWRPYHPSDRDYQSKGDMRRWMFRCPDLDSAVHQLSVHDVEVAFEEASEGQNVVLAFFEHDRRDNVADKIKEASRLIHATAKSFSEVNWSYTNALEAAQGAIGLQAGQPPVFKASIQDHQLRIEALGELFCKDPFVCAKTGQEYVSLPVHIIGQNKWITSRLSWSDIEKIGIAGLSPSGVSGVNNFNHHINQGTSELKEGRL
jgi:hypothetical protein